MKTLVYIPSFPAEPAAVLKEHIIDKFGGATFYSANGAWRMPDGKVCTEPVEIVEVFTSGNSRAVNESWFYDEATRYGLAAKQDAVLLVHDNEPVFVATRAAA